MIVPKIFYLSPIMYWILLLIYIVPLCETSMEYNAMQKECVDDSVIVDINNNNINTGAQRVENNMYHNTLVTTSSYDRMHNILDANGLNGGGSEGGSASGNDENCTGDESVCGYDTVIIKTLNDECLYYTDDGVNKYTVGNVNRDRCAKFRISHYRSGPENDNRFMKDGDHVWFFDHSRQEFLYAHEDSIFYKRYLSPWSTIIRTEILRFGWLIRLALEPDSPTGRPLRRGDWIQLYSLYYDDNQCTMHGDIKACKSSAICSAEKACTWLDDYRNLDGYPTVVDLVFYLE